MVTPTLDWPRNYPREAADQLRDGLARIVCIVGHERGVLRDEATDLADNLLPVIWRALKVAATGGNAQVLTDDQAAHIGAAVEVIVCAVPVVQEVAS